MNAQINDRNSPLWMRYEPRSFTEVAGNQNAVKRLIPLAMKRSAKPFLVHGPTGTGKNMLARIFSRSFMCEGVRHSGYEPCGDCRCCESVIALSGNAGSMGDRVAVEIAAGKTGKSDEAVNGFLDTLRFFPGPIIVGEADRFLKSQLRLVDVLAELLRWPIFFTTTDKSKFIPEFVSRCTQIETHEVADKDMVPYLRTVALKEGVSDPDEVVRRVMNELSTRKETGLVRNAMQELEVQIAMARRS